MTYASTRTYPYAEASQSNRTPGKLIVGALLVAGLVLTLIVLQLYQASSEGTATRALRRSVAALTELDVLVAQQYDQLQTQAATAAPGDVIVLDGYPLAVQLSPNEVGDVPQNELRETIVSESAAILYSDGTSAWRAVDGSDPGRFTAAGAVDRSMDLLREDVHDVSLIALTVLAAVSLILVVFLATFCRGFGKIGAVGVAILFAAIPVLLGGALGRLFTAGADDDHYLRDQLFAIGHGLSSIPLRDGLAFAALGASLIIVAMLGDRLTRRQPHLTGTRP